MTAARKPPMWLALLAAVLVVASFPIDGPAGIALAFAGVACSARYLVLNRRYHRGGA